MKGPRGVELVQGELITFAVSAARTTNGNSGWIFVGGERQRFVVVLDITASATDAADTLDVYLDFSFDGTDSIGNAIHFTQQAGTGAARTEFAVLDPANPGTSVVNVTSDAASGVVRPALFGPYVRARWVIVDGAPGGGDQSHTFSVQAYAVT